jgi:CRP-like cAMP-binding protein
MNEPKNPPSAKKPEDCDVCESRGKGFFCQTPGETLKKIDSAKGLRIYKPGEPIFQAGEEPDGIYCLKSGTVKIESLGDNGQAHLLHVVNAGGVLGLRAALDGEAFQASAIALQPTELCFIPKEVFSRVLRDDPTIALNALRAVTLELQEMEKRFCHATDLSAVERIAEALLHLKDRFESQQWSRREFAEWASTTTETVIRTLAQFEKEGLIQLEGRKILIRDRKGLLEKARIFV